MHLALQLRESTNKIPANDFELVISFYTTVIQFDLKIKSLCVLVLNSFEPSVTIGRYLDRQIPRTAVTTSILIIVKSSALSFAIHSTLYFTTIPAFSCFQ